MGGFCMVFCTLLRVSTEASIKRVVETNYNMSDKSLLSLWKVKWKSWITESVTWASKRDMRILRTIKEKKMSYFFLISSMVLGLLNQLQIFW